MNDYKTGVVEALLYSIYVIDNATKEEARKALMGTLINVNISIVEDFMEKLGDKPHG